MSETIERRWRRGMALIGPATLPGIELTGRLIGITNSISTGDLELAAECAVEGRRLAVELALPTWTARFGVWAAATAHAMGDRVKAAELSREALEHGLRVDDADAVIGATVVLRTTPGAVSDHDLDVPLLEDVLGLARSRQSAVGESLVLAALTRTELTAGRADAAAGWCVQRLALGMRRGWGRLLGISLVHVVLIAYEVGDDVFAARVLGALQGDSDRVLRSMTPETAIELGSTRSDVIDRLGPDRARTLLMGGSLLSLSDVVAEATVWLRRHAEAAEPEADDAPPALTGREREVLALLTEGLTNKEIAGRLFVSAKTVMHHSMAIYRKLGVRGRAEATAAAYRLGLTPAAPPISTRNARFVDDAR